MVAVISFGKANIMVNAKALSARDAAESLAIAALGYIAGNPDALGRFLALSGIGPATLRESAADPGFLAGVLDFMVSDEPLLIAFAEETGFTPQAVAAAREVLGGAEQ
jgi:hypothetical protein